MKERYMSNNYGEVEVLSETGRKGECLIRFLNTGYERTCLKENLKAGKVKDLSVQTKLKETLINKELESNTSGKFLIIKKVGPKAHIMFTETGTTKECIYENAVKGKVSDPYRKSVYGIGVYGEFKKKPEYFKQAEQLWRNMLKRCYSEKDTRGYFGKAFVCPRWQYFPNFIEDLPNLPDFDKWLQGHSPKNENYNLDKDSLVKGNKYYSKLTCRFLPESVNKSLTSKSTKGEARLKKYLSK